jgi:hypothetical protein
MASRPASVRVPPSSFLSASPSGPVPGNLFSAEIRIDQHGVSSPNRVDLKIGDRGVDSRYRWHRPLRAWGAVDRSRFRRDTRLGHVGSRIVRAARRGGGHRRVGAAGLGGPYPSSAHFCLSSFAEIRRVPPYAGRRAARRLRGAGPRGDWHCERLRPGGRLRARPCKVTSGVARQPRRMTDRGL